MVDAVASNNVKTFATSRNIYVTATLWSVIAMIIIVAFVAPQEDGNYFSFLIIIPILVALIWSLLDTRYIFHAEFFEYRSGPIRGKIKYGRIRRVQVDDSFFKSTTLKPGLGRKGLLIYFDKFEEIFVSPADREAFIAELRKRVPTLE